MSPRRGIGRRALAVAVALPLAACGDLPFAGDDDRRAADNVVQVSAASSHVCGLTRNGRVFCWGDNAGGRLGTGDDEARVTPVLAALPGPATFVAAADFGGCAIVSHELFCWGAESWNDSTLAPEPRAPGNEWVAAQVSGHACAIDVTGRAFCWGDNWAGQLGTGEADERVETPQPVSGDLRWRAISVGSSMTCGVTTDRRGYCWGLNWNGRLGIGVVDEFPDGVYTTPQDVAGGLRWRMIRALSSGACGLTDAGDAYCWGGGVPRPPQLPDTTSTAAPFPLGLYGSDLATGAHHVCVLDPGGGTFCWGDNRKGQLGTGDFQPQLSPRRIESGGDYLSVAAGRDFTCGITRSRDVECWGQNNRLQLGDGTAIDRPLPVRVQLP